VQFWGDTLEAQFRKVTALRLRGHFQSHIMADITSLFKNTKKRQVIWLLF
jgi:uncharacterized protein (DUF488 family)